MKLIIELPDEYQDMIDVVVADTKKQNLDRDDVTVESVLGQVCRQYIVHGHSQIMMNLPNEEEST